MMMDRAVMLIMGIIEGFVVDTYKTVPEDPIVLVI